MLYDRKKDGRLAFPIMNQLELGHIQDSTEGGMLQLRDHILQTVRIRSIDPDIHRVGYLRIPREVVVADPRFQEEIEQYVPSLVLF